MFEEEMVLRPNRCLPCCLLQLHVQGIRVQTATSGVIRGPMLGAPLELSEKILYEVFCDFLEINVGSLQTIPDDAA